MLSCKEVVERSSDYLEKQLTLKERLRVAFHLLICGNCREFMRHMKTGLAMFKSMPGKELPDAEAEEITRRAIRGLSDRSD